MTSHRRSRPDARFPTISEMSAPLRRYFDNAATSHPKPPEVARAMVDMLTRVGGPGRGAYAEAREAGRVIEQCRERIARLVNLVGADGALARRNVVFTLNTSDALNMAIKGVLAFERARLGPGTPVHVVSTVMEHNSVLRPMHAMMSADGALAWTRVPADPVTGLVDPEDVRRAVRPGVTRLIIVNHASNVSGALQDLGAIGRIRAQLEASLGPAEAPLLLVDAAQSLGHVPVDVTRDQVDLLAFPGHKGLLGPTGTGGLCIRPGVERRMATYREGGTGNVSEEQTHPSMMPEKFEAGSHNTVGLAGLNAAVGWLLERGVEMLREHEIELMRRVLARFSAGADGRLRLGAMTLLGPAAIERRVGVFSLVHEQMSPAEMGAVLESEFGVLTRAGLHCAPIAHETLQSGADAATVRQGACRLSLGPFLDETDVDAALDALEAIAGPVPESDAAPGGPVRKNDLNVQAGSGHPAARAVPASPDAPR